MVILNFTQHVATQDQLAAGVVDLSGSSREYMLDLLTFVSLPSFAEVQDRAETLASFAQVMEEQYYAGGMKATCMIGGAPFFMGALEKALLSSGIAPCYAFSERVSEEQAQADGSVRKVNVFKHVGFVQVEA